MSTVFQSVVPILRIFDVDKAKEFYAGFLGFTVDWEHRFEANTPTYMQVSRGNLVLHLSEHYGDCCPGSTVYVRTAGIEALHKEISAKRYKYLRPGLDLAPWGGKCMEVIDPFGNRLRFNEDPAPQDKDQTP
jgi:catechol 2,3-dioxygenase-like lactoylglutathione lyase family enzyme